MLLTMASVRFSHPWSQKSVKAFERAGEKTHLLLVRVGIGFLYSQDCIKQEYALLCPRLEIAMVGLCEARNICLKLLVYVNQWWRCCTIVSQQVLRESSYFWLLCKLRNRARVLGLDHDMDPMSPIRYKISISKFMYLLDQVSQPWHPWSYMPVTMSTRFRLEHAWEASDDQYIVTYQEGRSSSSECGNRQGISLAMKWLKDTAWETKLPYCFVVRLLKLVLENFSPGFRHGSNRRHACWLR